ncbi:MAG TPA: TonB-dependent receptor [Vicinamibacterales bacterium]|nr:TonB-dependent receptor [Vicinamibacterales bacterium]
MRTWSVLGSLLMLGMFVALPTVGYAQDSVMTGTVTDSTGAVLPGVTVTATNVDSGNTFVAVSDERGNFRIPVRIGNYRIAAELTGFATVNRTTQMLVGQTGVVNFQLAPSTLQETVTVTGETPLVNTATSSVGANIDPRQMSELPLNGRNWMDLSLLAPGARRNEANGLVENRQGYASTKVDGQEVTTIYHSAPDAEQPGFNRDAIAEFEVLANRFDATQGHSAGMIVNAVTKSGTNLFAGTFGGYFRNDEFNAPDLIAHRVLPYSNQQLSGTVGGPIVRDRIHFFASYGYAREPQTFVYTSPYPAFNIDQHFTSQSHTLLGRLDYQFTPATRLSVRGSGYHTLFYNGGANSATVHPSAGGTRGRTAPQYFATLTHVISSNTINEIRGGFTDYERQDQPAVRWKGGDFPYHPTLHGTSMIIMLRGYTIGADNQNIFQDTQTIRDDLSTSYNWAGRHDVKVGGEYMRFHNRFIWCLRCNGVIDATTAAPPSAAELQQMFPVWNDASTWNVAPLAPITRWVFHSLSDTEHKYAITRHLFAGWVQDDWKASAPLTLNLGVRYDFDTNSYAERTKFLPWLPGNLPHDSNNVAPRLGASYKINDRTALRGGYGLFFAFAPNDGIQQTEGYLHRFENQIINDGTADFTTVRDNFYGWFHGPKPSFDDALKRACDVNFVQGCVYRSLVQEISYPGRQTSYSHQASAGIQRQFGTDMSLEVNYVFTGGRNEETAQQVNLTYNPATGGNYPFTNINTRAFPQWGAVDFELLEGWSNYNAADFTFTKRFSHRWQGSATYTLAQFKDADPRRDQWYIASDGLVARRPIGFPLAPDMGGEYTAAGAYSGGGVGAAGDQRHRAVVNGVWDAGYGFQLSGIYFFGSGERRRTNFGSDLRDEGGTVGIIGAARLRRDGSIIPRTGIVGDPIHRVDVRLLKKFPLGGRRSFEGMIEAFNLFNHANYGSYVINESNANYGKPAANENLAYQPRMLQLGFRTTF